MASKAYSFVTVLAITASPGSELMVGARRQVWAFYTALAALTLSVVAAISANLSWAVGLSIFALFAWTAARVWNRREPIPMPYSMRWILLLPRGPNSPRHLTSILRPQAGERILEVGPGVGIHAVAIAPALLPKGNLSVVDLQHQMLDHLKRRAAKKCIANVLTTRADAQALPFHGQVFDAVYMVGTLGEIPNELAALHELRRVLKPRGRLVIGEVLIDPDFVSVSTLKEKASEAGLIFETQTGPIFSYFARFRPAVDPTSTVKKLSVSN